MVQSISDGRNSKTKILVVPNAGAVESRDGLVADDLVVKLVNTICVDYSVTLAQDVLPMQSGGISRTRVPTSNVRLVVLGDLRARNRGLGIHLIIRRFYRLLREVEHTDAVVAFLPGTVSSVAARAAVFREKQLFVYARGVGALSNRSIRIARHAMRVYGVPGIAAMLEEEGLSVAQVAPMLAFTGDTSAQPESPVATWPDGDLLFVGRLVRDKGVGDLLEAVNVLREAGWQGRLTLAGGGGEGKAFRSMAGRCSAPIDFLGVVVEADRLRREYEKCSLVVLPTYHEGFPRTIAEALLSGRAVVATNVGGIGKTLTPGRDFFDCRVGDPASLARTIEAALRDPVRRARTAHSGRRVIQSVLPPFRSELPEAVLQDLRSLAIR